MSFQDLYTQVEPAIQRFARCRFNDYDRATREDVLQDTHIAMWQTYCKNPAEWEAKPIKVWTAYSRLVAQHKFSRLHRRTIERVTVNTGDLVLDEDDDKRTGEDILSCLVSTPDEDIDTRLDLEIALARAIAQIPEHYRADARLVLIDMIAGYSQIEVQQRHEWGKNHTQTLYKLLRSSCRQVFEN